MNTIPPQSFHLPACRLCSSIQRWVCLGVIILLNMLCAASSMAQTKARIYGYVVDTDNHGVDFANVFVKNTNIGTTTNKNGYYDLQIESSDSVTIVYSMMGYKPIEHTMLLTERVIQISVELQADVTVLSDLEVKAQRKQTSTLDYVDAKTVRLVPDATGGSIESLLITFAGVSQTNELSSQYSVRGGNFDENSVYVNGTEVYRPLLLRAGQQEGLSFVNPSMVDQVAFSAGGFDAKYGDKMSSVLDITYKRPNRFESSFALSLLGASAYVGTGNDHFTQMHGIRYKTAQYLLGTLDTKGQYKPNFIDYQTYLTYAFNDKWEMTFLGNFSQNKYTFVPDTMSTDFGTFQMPLKLKIYYDGQERDMFQTAFGSLAVNYKPNQYTKLGLSATGFYTYEKETFDITSQYWLSEIDMNKETEDKAGALLGIGTHHTHARNRLNLGVITLAHQGEFRKNNNTLLWGASVQREIIHDKISEWEWRDSVGYSLPAQNPGQVDLYYSMKSDVGMDSYRVQAFAQDTYKWRNDAGAFSVTGGLRASYWTFNNELLVSPRLSFSYLPGWKRDFSFRFATGLYYQSPFYKEIRDTLTNSYGVTEVHLNSNIKAQRSVHVLLGGDYYFRAFGRPFKFTTEAYYKWADRVISYTVDNVRVRYSGQNDAKAYTTGVDFKLYGELVPGADSWINLSLMQSREDLDYDSRGWIPRPNDQMYSFSLFFQDYWPNNPRYKLHLKFIWADGLPFGPPRNVESKSLFKSTPYRRVDIGASRLFKASTDQFMRKAKHIDSFGVHIELFNLLNFNNVNSYYWVSDVMGTQYPAPNYLTGFMANLKLTLDLK